MSSEQMDKITGKLRAGELPLEDLISEAIIQQSPVGISVRDRNGNLVKCNSSWTKIWNMTPERVQAALSRKREKLQMDERDSYLGDKINSVREIYEKGGDLTLDPIHIKSLDKWLVQRFYGIEALSDQMRYVVILTEDVTDTVEADRMHKELELSNYRYRNLVENLPVAVYSTMSDGRCLSANDTMVKMFEAESKEDLYREHVAQRYLNPDERKHFIEELLRSGRVQSYEVELITLKGKAFWASISATATIDKNGEITSIDGIIRDISSRKALEKEILKNQKLESLGILAGGIAHDFNNIMAAVLGNISLAMLYSKGDEKIMEKLDNAEKASIRASELTRQLLTFSKGGSPVKRTTDVREIISEAALFAATGSQTLIRFDLPEDLWSAEVDESQLGQVVNNLVLNSIQASPDGCEMNISACNVTLSESNRFSIAGGRYVRLILEDNGPGIHEDIQSRIFDPYFTTKSSGSGLGLATAYSIVKNHSGSITLEKATGGSLFYIHLPSTGADAPIDLTADMGLFTGMGKVLVMDDEPSVLTVVSEILTRHGYTAATARDGRIAVELYKEAFDDGNPFDAVITDITVPGGMGGVEAATLIREIDPKAKLIVASGYSNNAVMANYLQHGFIDSLAKPFRMNVLLEAVSRAVNS